MSDLSLSLNVMNKEIVFEPYNGDVQATVMRLDSDATLSPWIEGMVAWACISDTRQLHVYDAGVRGRR